MWLMDYLTGPTRREFSGSFIPNIRNVKVEGPSFPTSRASQLFLFPCKNKGDVIYLQVFFSFFLKGLTKSGP